MVQKGVYIIPLKTQSSKAFDYKTSITGKLGDNNITKDFEIALSVKYLSKFWITLDMPLTNCDVSLALTWSINCVLSSKSTRNAAPRGVQLIIQQVQHKIKDTKLYVPVVNLSGENDNKIL